MPPNLLAHYLYLWELTAVRQAVETAWISGSVRRTFVELLVPAGSSSSLGAAAESSEQRTKTKQKLLLDRKSPIQVRIHFPTGRGLQTIGFLSGGAHHYRQPACGSRMGS